MLKFWTSSGVWIFTILLFVVALPEKRKYYGLHGVTVTKLQRFDNVLPFVSDDASVDRVQKDQTNNRSLNSFLWRKRSLCAVSGGGNYFSGNSYDKPNVIGEQNNLDGKRTLLDYEAPAPIDDVEDLNHVKPHARVKRNKSKFNISLPFSYGSSYHRDLANSFPQNPYDNGEDEILEATKREIKYQSADRHCGESISKFDEQVNNVPVYPDNVLSAVDIHFLTEASAPNGRVTLNNFISTEEPCLGTSVNKNSIFLKKNTDYKNRMGNIDHEEIQVDHLMGVTTSKVVDGPQDSMLTVDELNKNNYASVKTRDHLLEGVDLLCPENNNINPLLLKTKIHFGEHTDLSNPNSLIAQDTDSPGKNQSITKLVNTNNFSNKSLSTASYENLNARSVLSKRKASKNNVHWGKPSINVKGKGHISKKGRRPKNNLFHKKRHSRSITRRNSVKKYRGVELQGGLFSNKNILLLNGRKNEDGKDFSGDNSESLRAPWNLNTTIKNILSYLKPAKNANRSSFLGEQKETHKVAGQSNQLITSLKPRMKRDRGTEETHAFQSMTDELKYYEDIHEPGPESIRCADDEGNSNLRINKRSSKRAVRPIDEVQELAKKLVAKVKEVQHDLNSDYTEENQRGEKKIKVRAIDDLCSNVKSAYTVSKETPKIIQRYASSIKHGFTPTPKIVVTKKGIIGGNKSKRKRSKAEGKRLGEQKRSTRNSITTARSNKRQRDSKKKRRHKWYKWTDWSSCTVTCGKGRQIRWRHCLKDCTDAETEMEEKACQLPACGPGKFLGIF